MARGSVEEVRPAVRTWLSHLGQERRDSLNVTLALVVSVLGNLMALGVAGYVFVYGFPAYIVPPGGPGLVRPGFVDQLSAEAYAKQWFQARYTFTPETIKDVQDAILTTLHPRLHPAWKAQADRERQTVKDRSLSNALVPLHATVVARRGNALTVRVEASLAVYVGGVESKKELITPTIDVALGWAHGVPVGLIVTRVPDIPQLRD